MGVIAIREGGGLEGADLKRHVLQALVGWRLVSPRQEAV